MLGMMHWGGYGWDGGWLGWVGMAIWWVLIVFLVVSAIRWFSDRADSAAPRGKSALEILEERYVKGEIEKKEYQEKRKALES
ncbi:MAG: SHOCT domain-containing protein [Candidatus Brennerbacteria bacterium]